jgi:hypothetical protein
MESVFGLVFNNNAYEDVGGTTYKTLDEVKAFYMEKIEKAVAAAAAVFLI